VYVTNASGLYRYEMNDIIEVAGLFEPPSTPASASGRTIVTQRAGCVGGWTARAWIVSRHTHWVNQFSLWVGGDGRPGWRGAASQVQRPVLGRDRRADHVTYLALRSTGHIIGVRRDPAA
jgi:hypothetical protein